MSSKVLKRGGFGAATLRFRFESDPIWRFEDQTMPIRCPPLFRAAPFFEPTTADDSGTGDKFLISVAPTRTDSKIEAVSSGKFSSKTVRLIHYSLRVVSRCQEGSKWYRRQAQSPTNLRSGKPHLQINLQWSSMIHEPQLSS